VTRAAAGTLLAAVLATGCASSNSDPPRADGQGSSLAERVAGCWSLELLASGSEMESIRTWLPAGTMPTGIELDTSVAPGGRDDSTFRARSLQDGRRETDPFSTWRPMRGDSLLVQRAGAMAGYALRLAPENGAMEGVVVGFSDVRQPGTPESQGARTARVRVARMECP